MVPQRRPQRNHWLRLPRTEPTIDRLATLSTVTVRQRIVVALLIGAVALAFADASVVALALPDLYGEFDTTIVGVSWVLTTYALAVAVASVPVAVLHRRVRPLHLVVAGAAVFTAASLVAGLATGLTMLLAARAAQGVGAALLLAGSLPVLVALGPGPRTRATMVGARRCGRGGDGPGARRSVDRTVLVAGDLPLPGTDRRRCVGRGRRRTGAGRPRPGRRQGPHDFAAPT